LYVPREDAAMRRVVLQETRSLLLELLRRPRADGKRGWTVQELSRRLDCTAQNAHHHLQILRDHGLAHVAIEEPTNGIPRQYWSTHVAHVYTDMAADAKSALALEKARAHHAGDDGEAYFARHFRALGEMGIAITPDLQPDVAAFYRRESALFAREFARMDPVLRGAAARWGVGETKSALHFAAIAAFSEAEFDAWVDGLRLLRKAARAPPKPMEAAP
jgi:helix-turn-helix protein